MDKEIIKGIANIVSQSFTSPELFQVGVEQMAKDWNISEAECGSMFIACYGYHLWEDDSLKDFLSDWLREKFNGEE